MLLSKQLSLSSLILLCRTLRHNLSAGLMLRDVFQQMAKRGTTELKPIAARIADSLESGNSMELALKQEKDYFPPLFLALAGVGENTGHLPEIFNELEKYFAMQQKFWRQFFSQALYPAIQFVMATLIIAGVFVILGWIAETKNSKPIDILGFGLVGVRGAVIFLGIIYGTLALLFAGYLSLSRSLKRKAAVDGILLKLFAVGPFLQALALARFCLALRLTMDTSMPIQKALRLSLKATGNAAFESYSEKIDDALVTGEDLTSAMSLCPAFPRDFLDIVAVSETGGRVPEVMGNQASVYEEEAARRLSVLTQVANWLVWLFVASLIIIAIFKFAMFYLHMIDDALKMVN